jgi:hypothetical protein
MASSVTRPHSNTSNYPSQERLNSCTEPSVATQSLAESPRDYNVRVVLSVRPCELGGSLLSFDQMGDVALALAQFDDLRQSARYTTTPLLHKKYHGQLMQTVCYRSVTADGLFWWRIASLLGPKPPWNMRKKLLNS